jgi:hypothetical protein
LRGVDEYVALRVVFGDWPAEIPHDVLGLTYTRHWRLLSTMANPTGGRISRALAALSSQDRELIRRPHPDLLEVLDPRAAIRFQWDLYFGDPQNAVGPIREHAGVFGLNIIVAA